MTRAVHGSVHREDVARHNAAFLEGVCAAIDELRALGEHGAADRLEAALFVPTTAWNDGSIVATLAPAPADPTALAPTPAPAEFARSQGYTGDQCTHCNSMRMKTSGHCMVCEDCGTTTGCS